MTKRAAATCRDKPPLAHQRNRPESADGPARPSQPSLDAPAHVHGKDNVNVAPYSSSVDPNAHLAVFNGSQK